MSYAEVDKKPNTVARRNRKVLNSTRRVLAVHVDQIVPKDQVRKSFRNIDELAHSLLTEGQQSPIIVSPRNSDGKFVIQKGERRWRACKLVGIEMIDVLVNHNSQNKLDETAGELIENIQRESLTAMEIAEALSTFVRNGWKQIDVAERLGKSAKFVSSHLGLLKLPDCVKRLYEEGVCADADTLNNLRQLYDIDPRRCKRACSEAMADGMSRKRSRELLNKARGRVGDVRPVIAPPAVGTANPASSRYGLDKPQVTGTNENKEIHIIISVKKPTEVLRGELITDRQSPHSGFVWVRTPNEHGYEETYCVRASDVEIIRVEIKKSFKNG